MPSRVVPDHLSPPSQATCPRCGRPMVRVEHTIAGSVVAQPCGCPVRYRIDGGQVEVEGDAA